MAARESTFVSFVFFEDTIILVVSDVANVDSTNQSEDKYVTLCSYARVCNTLEVI
jgi:hypothetical protein